jgi:hypothetical protein
MRKNAFPVLCLLCMVLLAPCMAQLPKNFMPDDHPRILLLKNEESALKMKIKSDSSFHALFRVITKECDDLISTQPVEEKLIGKRLLKNAREFRRRVFFLSFAWRISGNNAYFERARAEMLHVAAFSSWNPSHFLDVAEMTMGMAVGYDWLFHSLSSEDRLTIRKAILEKGLTPGINPDYTKWLTEINNWNQVCNSGMTFGALAIFETDPGISRTIIERSVGSIELAMKDYEPDGVYTEGYGYWNYGTSFNVLYLSALEKAIGNSFGPKYGSGFLKTAYYPLHMIGNSGQCFNYSDGDPQPVLNPAMFWFAAKLKDPSILFREVEMLHTSRHLHRVREFPMLMIWGSELPISSVGAPQTLLWMGRGRNPVALMRSSWDRDGIFVGFKAGSPSAPHGHMDVGSFVIDALGERWAMDFQNQDYNSLEQKGVKLFSMKQTSQRWNLIRINNKGHNTLTFDGELQQVSGYAGIETCTYDESFLSATSDLTQLYYPRATKVERGIAIVDKRYVVIKDEIMGGNLNTTIRWAMLTAAQVTIENPTTAVLKQKGKTVMVKVLEPVGLKLTTWSTKPPNAIEDDNPGTTFLGFDINLAHKRDVVITVQITPVQEEVAQKSKGTVKAPGRLKEWAGKKNR